VFQPEDPSEAKRNAVFFAVALEAVRRHRELEISYCNQARSVRVPALFHPLHLAKFLDQSLGADRAG